MLRLFLLRHAEAVPAGGDDLARRLTPEGRAAARRIGGYLRETGEQAPLTLVSPARRTIETLEEVEGAFGAPLPRRIAPPLYQAAMTTIDSLIAETPAAVRALLVLGHNPGIAETANALVKTGSAADLARLRKQFPAPCLAVISFEVGDWRKAVSGRGRLDRLVTAAVLQKSEEGA